MFVKLKDCFVTDAVYVEYKVFDKNWVEEKDEKNLEILKKYSILEIKKNKPKVNKKSNTNIITEYSKNDLKGKANA